MTLGGVASVSHAPVAEAATGARKEIGPLATRGFRPLGFGFCFPPEPLNRTPELYPGGTIFVHPGFYHLHVAVVA